ncbi:SGM1 (YJR134C) [Zygosaccharomyces parabailii]|nr:SGM1 (YJR134C) [Zygosaccharomyces parabailii]
MSEPKKLSLEERLSLAARKNRKRGKRASPAPTSLSAASGTIEEANQRAESDEKVTRSADKNAKENQVDLNKSQSPTLEADSVSLDTTEPILVATDNAHEAQYTKEETQIALLNSLKNVAPWSFFLPTNAKVSSVEDFLDILRPAVQLMYDDSEQMKKKIAATNKNEESRENDSMKEKDELINQLRYEGEKLASKELRQNNAIKALKKKICGMENDMNILKEELSKKISAFEDITLSYEEFQSQVQESEIKMRELCKENEHLKDLEVALNKGEAEISSLRSSLQESRKTAIEQERILNGEIEALKFASEEQVTNLEAALEHLRIELDQTSRKTITATNASCNEHLLSQELEECKRNWSKLENTLNDKISEMETLIHRLEESKREQEKQLISSQQLNNSLESKMLKERQEKENNSTTYYNLKQETDKLRKELQDTTEDYQLLQKSMKYSICN